LNLFDPVDIKILPEEIGLGHEASIQEQCNSQIPEGFLQSKDLQA
jgi:hypothetical protein